MRYAWILGLAIVCTPPPLQAEDNALAALDWISGAWARSNEKVQMEEYWSSPAGGVMLGLHRDVFANGRTFFEYLRIEQRGDNVFYIAIPNNQKLAEFRLTDLGEQRAVFENPEHDFPQKIVYERDGNTLTATVEGIANGKRRSSSWQWDLNRPD